ncbi:hypothetical protein [Psychroflexus planctonicus]|uniref:Uncharacterized protein n=1 Tax=Psychroflexus planctonicus TaxID=1526575 RepID=A0ABQ1SEH5_9FLAO|nr:hypothetical protein [Psychroflexus planctonicus]GGE27404.1 hypothetical protein GCM10010832_05130 [Psychroflexus planctonicus]
MKKTLLFISFTLITTICFGQNLFFIGDNSYPCTEAVTLYSNRTDKSIYLDIVFAKDNEKGFLVLSTQSRDGSVRIKDKLLIYLDDGSVITCLDRNIFDNVDFIATTVYYLTKEELKKMKTSNINTIRFSIKCSDCLHSSEEGDFSATNKASNKSYSKKEKIDFTSIVKNLFN